MRHTGPHPRLRRPPPTPDSRSPAKRPRTTRTGPLVNERTRNIQQNRSRIGPRGAEVVATRAEEAVAINHPVVVDVNPLPLQGTVFTSACPHRADLVARARNPGRRKAVAANGTRFTTRARTKCRSATYNSGSVGGYACPKAASPERPRSVVNAAISEEADRRSRSRRHRRGSDSEDSDRGHSDDASHSDSSVQLVENGSPGVCTAKIPSLRHFAGPSREPIIASSSGMGVCNGQPISSNTARVRQAGVDPQAF